MMVHYATDMCFLPSRGQGRDNSICSANEYRGQGRDNTEDKTGASHGVKNIKLEEGIKSTRAIILYSNYYCPLKLI